MSATGKSGMTMLELLIAMALFAIIMTAAFPLVDQMLARFQMARDHYVAASLCQGRIERARAVPYVDLRMMAEEGVRTDDYGNLSEPDGRFRRTTTITVDSPVAGMTTMRVQAHICICSRWGWRKCMHPMRTGKWLCRFTDEQEAMSFYFTDYKK